MEALFPQGWIHYLAGGLLLGAAVSLLFVLTGWIGGMSTLFSSTWSFVSRAPGFADPRLTGSRVWRSWYAMGLIGGGALYLLLAGSGAGFMTAVPWWQLLLGGFIAGFGARLSNGCTAGHGICGMASLQLPSLLAVITFLITAMITANLVAALGGAK
ncbi:MAG: YeeE/YedE family protein [Burkholderiales bacterium]